MKAPTTIQITTFLAILGALGTVGLWYDGVQAKAHVVIVEKAVADDAALSRQMFTDNVDVTLELVEAKLKMYRVIRERRALTPDEAADEVWLKERKSILLSEQRKRRA